VLRGQDLTWIVGGGGDDDLDGGDGGDRLQAGAGNDDIKCLENLDHGNSFFSASHES
jgi:Ca2+-binding RTX toxin-like protein